MQRFTVLAFLVIAILTFTSTTTTYAGSGLVDSFVNSYVGHPSWRTWSSNIDSKTDARGWHLRIWLLELIPHAHTASSYAYASLGIGIDTQSDPSTSTGGSKTWLINHSTFPGPSRVDASASLTGPHHHSAYTYGWVIVDGSTFDYDSDHN